MPRNDRRTYLTQNQLHAENPDMTTLRTVHPPSGAPQVRRRRPRWQTMVSGIGQTVLTAGVVLLLFVVYEMWFTDYLNSREQHRLNDEIHHRWERGDDPLVGDGNLGQSVPDLPNGSVPDIPLGTGIAIIRIPAFGLDYARVVVEGTGETELYQGPGHYVGTALPGQVGNFAIAGHRVSKGSPFLDLDKLKPSDPLVIETKDTWYVYRVLPFDSPIPGREIVGPSDGEVLLSVPSAPAQQPAQRLITLTTCHPKFSPDQRLIIHGRLDSTQPKTQGSPNLLKDVR